MTFGWIRVRFIRLFPRQPWKLLVFNQFAHVNSSWQMVAEINGC